MIRRRRMLTGLTSFLPENMLSLYDNLEFLIRIPFSGILRLAIWGHLALQAVPSRQVKYGLT